MSASGGAAGGCSIETPVANAAALAAWPDGNEVVSGGTRTRRAIGTLRTAGRGRFTIRLSPWLTSSEPTTIEPIPRPGLTITRDEYGVAHITGTTRDDVSYGAGFVAGEDRNLLLQLGRGPARAAVADVPGLNAFGLVTSGKSFTPSKQAERLVASEKQALVRAFGSEGRAMLHDFEVYAQGVTA